MVALAGCNVVGLLKGERLTLGFIQGCRYGESTAFYRDGWHRIVVRSNNYPVADCICKESLPWYDNGTGIEVPVVKSVTGPRAVESVTGPGEHFVMIYMADAPVVPLDTRTAVLQKELFDKVKLIRHKGNEDAINVSPDPAYEPLLESAAGAYGFSTWVAYRLNGGAITAIKQIRWQTSFELTFKQSTNDLTPWDVQWDNIGSGPPQPIVSESFPIIPNCAYKNPIALDCLVGECELKPEIKPKKIKISYNHIPLNPFE